MDEGLINKLHGNKRHFLKIELRENLIKKKLVKSNQLNFFLHLYIKLVNGKEKENLKVGIIKNKTEK